MLNKKLLSWGIRIVLFFALFSYDTLLSPLTKNKNFDEITAAEATGVNYIKNDLSDLPGMKDMEKSLKKFMKRWHVPGASVGIVNDGKFIYAKGLGYADKENKEEVQPNTLFRLASISKLLTATAIMKLHEENKLSIYDTVFGSNGILQDSSFSKVRDKNVEKIIVKNLMDHTGGWSLWGGDPMFMPRVIARIMDEELPLNEKDITQFVLKYRRLRWQPGTRSCYSNFGYMLLGMIIEEKTGMKYEDYVKTKILNPLGIKDMYIGYSMRENAHPRETKYYAPSNQPKVRPFFDDTTMVEKQYGGNDIRTLGAAGGWIGSTISVMKFVTAIDGLDNRTDIISKESIELMTNNPTGSLGWKGVNEHMWWRTGSLAGTSAMVVRQDNGLEWVVILNASTWKGSDFTRYIYYHMSRALKTIDKLPDNDLFLYNSVCSLYK